MRKILVMFLTMAFVAAMVVPAFADDSVTEENSRLKESGQVLREVLNVPENIPQDLLDRAECVIVFPSVKKAAFVVGASYGRGAMSCRTGTNWNGHWGAPTMMALEGGSFGLQIGVQSTDFVILVMNARGANSILTSKVKLGADASIAAGPKGRNAAADTDIFMRAEMLSYSRAQGVFIGVSLAGSSLRPDNGANKVVYGKDMNAKELVHSSTQRVPPAAKLMVSILNRRSPHNRSNPKALQE